MWTPGVGKTPTHLGTSSLGVSAVLCARSGGDTGWGTGWDTGWCCSTAALQGKGTAQLTGLHPGSCLLKMQAWVLGGHVAPRTPHHVQMGGVRGGQEELPSSAKSPGQGSKDMV